MSEEHEDDHGDAEGGGAFQRLRRADLRKLRRRTGGRMGLDRPVADQREAFAALLSLTEVGMPAHRCDAIELGGVPCLRVTPTNHQPGRQIVYLHGGGYVLGSPETHRPLAARIARRTEAELILPRYRLAPEHPCPAGLSDVRALWSALGTARSRAGQGPAWLAGDSAGGGLALALAQALRDADELGPRGLVLLSPWTDLTVSGASVDALAQFEVLLGRPGLELMAGRYAGPLALDDVRVSPLFGRFEGLPPMLVQVGGQEVLLDDARRTAAMAEAAGVPVELQIYPGQAHVFQATPMIEAAAAAIAEIGAWVEACLSAQPES